MKILVIRRDNIGDLVCTTPVFSSLRQAFPAAYIAALVNTYSAPVIDNNPDIDAVFQYAKAKHDSSGQAKVLIWIRTLWLVLKLRARRFDIAIAIGNSSLALAKLISPGRIIVAATMASADAIPLAEIEPLHAVEAAHKYLTPLGIRSKPGPLMVYPDPLLTERQRETVQTFKRPIIGLHLSARKASQRWPVENYSNLARTLHRDLGASFMIFWSPGAETNLLHPGDDEKAKRFEQASKGLTVKLCPTNHLAELIAGMSLCDLIICGDGGAMHIAAGLGKPVVALFGDSDPERWRPWEVPCRVFHPTSKNVEDITVEEVRIAALSLVTSSAVTDMDSRLSS